MKKTGLLLAMILGSAMLSYASSVCNDSIKSKTAVIKECDKTEAIYTIIAKAIDVGAPTYNEGNHAGCFMIYEGAAYKILHKYGKRCKDITEILETALEKCNSPNSSTEKAWIMRRAFDRILGVPTVTE